MNRLDYALLMFLMLGILITGIYLGTLMGKEQFKQTDFCKAYLDENGSIIVEHNALSNERAGVILDNISFQVSPVPYLSKSNGG